MNYIGSKSSLLPFLDRCITSVVATDTTTFCDLFAGTGAVGSYFKQKGYSIIANDLQYYSYVLNRHYIGNVAELPFTGLRPLINKEVSTTKAVCDYLNALLPQKGFIYQNYSLGGTKGSEFERLYFSDENAAKCDAIRLQIELWHTRHAITDDEYYFLLASLLENMDKLANTASVYGAFLKKLKRTAQKPLELTPARVLESRQPQQVFQGDSNEIIRQLKCDILYLDPPYNNRQYAPNYHLLETIAKYDNPPIKGKTGLRDYTEQKSDYCMKSKVKAAFAQLIREADARYIFVSYNNEGLLTVNEIKEILATRGTNGCFTQEYNRFKADKTENRDHKATKTTEYLHYVICENSSK